MLSGTPKRLVLAFLTLLVVDSQPGFAMGPPAQPCRIAASPDELINCHVVLLACNPERLQLKVGRMYSASWFWSDLSRFGIAASAVSRSGGPAATLYVDGYLRNGFAWGIGLEVSAAGFTMPIEAIWYPLEDFQIAYGMDLLRAKPLGWACWRLK